MTDQVEQNTKANDVFAVFKQGVYRHECAGIFSTLDLAVAAAEAALAGERDDYHSYEVVPFGLDERVPQTDGYPYFGEREPLHKLSRR